MRNEDVLAESPVLCVPVQVAASHDFPFKTTISCLKFADEVVIAMIPSTVGV